MRDRFFETDATGCDQADGVFQMRLGADVRKNVTKTALPQKINVQWDGSAKPGNAHDLPAGTRQFQGLKECLVPGQPLLWAPAGAFENYVRAISAGPIPDRRNYFGSAR